MRCRYCDSRTRVVVTEHRPDGSHRWLRCLKCGASMRTLETLYQPPERVGRGPSFLTSEDVRRIRSRAAAGVPQQILAAEYDLHRNTISLIIHRKRYANVS